MFIIMKFTALIRTPISAVKIKHANHYAICPRRVVDPPKEIKCQYQDISSGNLTKKLYSCLRHMGGFG